MHIITLIGTRPEIINVAHIIPLFDKLADRHMLVHSGQHYDYNMNWIFFRDLGLREPDANFEIRALRPYAQVSAVIKTAGELASQHDIEVLEKHAALVLTDSGGVQEEASILRAPCVTLRHNTERLESVAVGASIIAGVHLEKVVAAVNDMIKKSRHWRNPLGDGESSERSCRVILRWYERRKCA